MATSVRTSWQVMRASVTALFIRNIQKKFITNINSSRTLGIFMIFLEPLLHVGMWMMLRSAFNMGERGSLPMPLFILLGAIPFLFLRHVISKSTSIIKSTKDLFNFRQVRPIDPILAGLISEFAIHIMILFMILSAFSWVGVVWSVHDLTYLLLNTVSFVIFVFGISLIFAIACFFFTIVKTAMTVFMRIFYMLSGIFFSADMLPEPARVIMLYNPLFQYIEMMRQCFNQVTVHTDYTDPAYLFKCAVVVLFLGLSLYVTYRDKIMIEIEQR